MGRYTPQGYYLDQRRSLSENFWLMEGGDVSKLYKNWFIHNMIGHPVSELAFWLVRPFVGLDKAGKVCEWVHDATIPEHEPETDRG